MYGTMCLFNIGADAGGESTSILPPTEHNVPLLGFPGGLPKA